MVRTAESERLKESGDGTANWKLWGPYLSERQWGTVREDYSQGGDAWDYFSHDQSRSRAYRWGEDGLGGISDEKQRLCFAIALWNGNDPIIKERLFGLTNGEGNHGEDVKEYYFYLDSSPTHSYMKYLYKYPQNAYPYCDLVETNKHLSRTDLEYELINTGIFDNDEYFDVYVEYAKRSPSEILIRVSAFNRGQRAATLHVLPTLWFRNTWSWGECSDKPHLQALRRDGQLAGVHAARQDLGEYELLFAEEGELLFTENESNLERLGCGVNPSPYVKDGFHEYVINGRQDSVNPDLSGTKSAVHYVFDVEPGRPVEVKLLLRKKQSAAASSIRPGDFADFEEIFALRKAETDEFYDSLCPTVDDDSRNVFRQALAGMLWSKQFYYFDLNSWLREHDANPLYGGKRLKSRNADWFHMCNSDILSMPDKWEYPWYAAWDLAFHTIPLALVDSDFAKQQLELVLDEVYLHPNGQIPAYEWNFGDVNPPVHAWAAMHVYAFEKEFHGKADVDFLERVFHKLLLNFSWWVNRKDINGRNIFQGGFLGLDNIGIFDRSQPLPTGGYLEQADGTAWMALYTQTLLEIAMELAPYSPACAETAEKFVEHFLLIASAISGNPYIEGSLWDEEDGFFYDVLRFPDGHATQIEVRSMVGLLPLCATTTIPQEYINRNPELVDVVQRFRKQHPGLADNIPCLDKPGYGGRRLLSVVDEGRLRKILWRLLSEDRFLGPHGIRALSRWHLEHPYTFTVLGQEYKVAYEPAESSTSLFGGNSNWRGPVWFPVNAMIVRALLQFYKYYGNDFQIECPTASGQMMNLYEVAQEITRRLISTFTRDENGRRPVYGGTEKFQTDPHWRDLILFYEYFHGENGAGLGASHQTGWTGLVAAMIRGNAVTDSERMLKTEVGQEAADMYTGGRT